MLDFLSLFFSDPSTTKKRCNERPHAVSAYRTHFITDSFTSVMGDWILCYAESLCSASCSSTDSTENTNNPVKAMNIPMDDCTATNIELAAKKSIAGNNLDCGHDASFTHGRDGCPL